MIEEKVGNLIEADAEALVNTVNIVGVMGKGVALQFKLAFPEMFRAYQKACRSHEVQIGKMFVYVQPSISGPDRFIINFPTKSHWREKSHINYIKDGLKSLIQEVKDRGIKSIAIPPLGCGMGGLNWAEVYPLICESFSEIPDVRVIIYPPQLSPDPKDLVINTSKPNLNWIRANIIRLLGKYCELDYRLSLLEVHKLLYFFQESGERDLRLKYVKREYGPFSENLKHLLEKFEGHYTKGLSDGSTNPKKSISLIPSAIPDANAFIDESKDLNPESEIRIQRVLHLIEGFETPYGLELLATVHWVVNHDGVDSEDLNSVIQAVHSWGVRKRTVMKPNHIRIAWEALKENGWFSPKVANLV
jgi:O-acetyl-ADP-ribose deacetylase (regulator of RNase III)